MSRVKAGLACLFALGVAFCACGEGNEGSGDSSGATDAGEPHCANVYTTDSVCGDCLQAKCCAEVAACGAVDYCIRCFMVGGYPNMCNEKTKPFVDAVAWCAYYSCPVECHFVYPVPDGGGEGGGSMPDGGGG